MPALSSSMGFLAIYSLHPSLSALPTSLSQTAPKSNEPWSLRIFQTLSHHLLLCVETLWASYFMCQLKLYIFLDLFSFSSLSIWVFLNCHAFLLSSFFQLFYGIDLILQSFHWCSQGQGVFVLPVF